MQRGSLEFDSVLKDIEELMRIIDCEIIKTKSFENVFYSFKMIGSLEIKPFP
jgi:hypothetical protein